MNLKRLLTGSIDINDPRYYSQQLYVVVAVSLSQLHQLNLASATVRLIPTSKLKRACQNMFYFITTTNLDLIFVCNTRSLTIKYLLKDIQIIIIQTICSIYKQSYRVKDSTGNNGYIIIINMKVKSLKHCCFTVLLE